jgi:ribonuclease HI
MKQTTIVIYTDGSCFGNGGKKAVAGMGVHFPNKELDDLSIPFTIHPITNQRAELGAIYLALQSIKLNYEEKDLHKLLVHMHTDSKYSIDCFEKYIHNWKKNEWMTSKKKSVANQDLIKRIDKYRTLLEIQFTHVYSHRDDNTYESQHNAIADKLATDGTRKN